MKNSLTPLLALSALLLTGCTAPETEATSESAPESTVSVAPAAPSTPAEESTATPTSAPTPSKNERGDFIKEIGSIASSNSVEGGPNTMNFKVTSIKPAVCDAPYPVEPNGTPLAVTLEIETTADFEGPITVNDLPGQISFSPYYWKGYADNGTRMNTVESPISRGCLANQSLLLPDYIGKGEKLNGQIILDVTTPTGSISFNPYGGPGWVWEYPSAN